MKGLKITIIGSGSTYTPELINGFITRRDSLHIDSIYMMDINREKNEIVSALAKRMLEHNGLHPNMVLTDNLEEAIEGANYVLGQVRVGMLDARINDEKIPLEFGLLGQETTGAGGFMKALRTIPVLMNVAETIQRLAPNAWLINFSNPSGIIAEAILNYTKVKTIGLCNNPINMAKDARVRLPEGTKEFDFDYMGLNHLSWITAIYADGKEILQDQLTKKIDSTTAKNVPKVEYDDALLKAVKGLPCPYLNYFYFRDKMIEKTREEEKCRGEVCKDIEAELLELYKDTSIIEKPAVLDKRGGALYSDAAISLIDAIENDKNEVHVVNVRNQGAYAFMDYDDVVEVKCLINKDGATPIPYKDFNNRHMIGLMRAVKAYEKLTVAAGLTGDYEAALNALLVHPLIGDYYKAKGVLDKMLDVNKEYLPQFNQK